jgi:hypothetical protein
MPSKMEATELFFRSIIQAVCSIGRNLVGTDKPEQHSSKGQKTTLLNRPARVDSKDFTLLSGLRGCAALAVVIRHIDAGAYIGNYGGLKELGVFMVGVFFFLSAFLLSVSPVTATVEEVISKC